MSTILHILLAATLVAVTSVVVGKVLLRWAGLALSALEETVLGGVLGSTCLAAASFALTFAGLGRRGVFTSVALILIAASAWSLWRTNRREPAAGVLSKLPLGWGLFFGTVYAVFGTMYLIVAMAPETSADGAGFHLGRVSVWLHGFSFRSAPDAPLPDGIESLFVFASAIGHHSAATLVEWLYLMALPVGMMLYGRRVLLNGLGQNNFGQARAGAVAGMLVLLSPIVARVGTIAAPDVAIACVAFTLF
ncbi:MAG: hypothetical protein ABI824_17430, partial [Acidobacteriota bacterium]